MKYLLGAPNTIIPSFKAFSTTVSARLFLKRQAMLYLVAWSIRWRTGCWSINLMSRATTSLNSEANIQLTTGRRGGRLKRLHVSQLLGTISTISSISLSLTPESLMSSFNFFAFGWANCLCSLWIFSYSPDHHSPIMDTKIVPVSLSVLYLGIPEVQMTRLRYHNIDHIS